MNYKKDRFSKPEIKQIRRNFYETKSKKKKKSKKRIKQIEKYLLELEKNLSQLKKYFDHDNIEYKGINLFDLSIDEDYYKPITTNETFNSNYIEHESKRDKDKTFN